MLVFEAGLALPKFLLWCPNTVLHG
jgi:hypothetical protein